jgi:hypothetical protein
MNANSLGSLLVLPIVFWSRNIDFSENSDNLLYCRVAFVAVQVLLLVVSFYIKLKIDEAKSLPSSKRVIKVPVQKVCFNFFFFFFFFFLFFFFSHNNQSPLAPADEASEKEQTVYQYDSDQWSAALKANVMQLLILGFIHYKWTIAVPLLTQLILGPIKLFSSELFQA